MIGCTDTSLNNAAPPPRRSVLDSSCSLFQCYVSKESQVSSRALWTTGGGVGGGASGGCSRRPSSSLEAGDGTLLQELAVTPDWTGKEAVLLAQVSIPNCVNSDQSSSVGEDNLLLGDLELPIILEGRGHRNHSDFNIGLESLRDNSVDI